MSWQIALHASMVLGSASVFAQTTVVEPEAAPLEEPTDEQEQIRFTLGGGALFQFDAGIDSGGDFNVQRLNGSFELQTNLEENLEMSLRLTYALDVYDFSDVAGLTGGAVEPWDDVHTAAAGLVFSWQPDDRWTLFGGPVVQTARESGTDFDDGLTAGGILGASYIASREFVIGGALAITSQIEDGVEVSPIVLINWVIDDQWRVSSRTTGNILMRSGAELVYDPASNWEFAFGVATYESRFRLDDQGPAPDGVGEEESYPIWLRATYAKSNFKIDAVAGLSMAGELQLEDDQGDNLAEEDYDAAPFVGAFATIRF